MSGETPVRRDPATGEVLREGAHGRYAPFVVGNTAAVTHGAYLSDLRLSTDRRVGELAEAIRATQPVSHPADEGAIQRLALCYWRLEVSAAALDVADRELAGRPLAAYTDKSAWLGRLREDHDRWHRLAGKIEAELARTPTSRSRLGLNLALAERELTLTDLAAEGRRIRLAREGGGDE